MERSRRYLLVGSGVIFAMVAVVCYLLRAAVEDNKILLNMFGWCGLRVRSSLTLRQWWCMSDKVLYLTVLIMTLKFQAAS